MIPKPPKMTPPMHPWLYCSALMVQLDVSGLPRVATLGANVYALVAVAEGWRSTNASTLRHLALRCGIAVAVLIGVAALFIFLPHDGSAAINGETLATVGCVLPSAAGLWLRWKAHRAA